MSDQPSTTLFTLIPSQLYIWSTIYYLIHFDTIPAIYLINHLQPYSLWYHHSYIGDHPSTTLFTLIPSQLYIWSTIYYLIHFDTITAIYLINHLLPYSRWYHPSYISDQPSTTLFTLIQSQLYTWSTSYYLFHFDTITAIYLISHQLPHSPRYQRS